MARDDHYLTAKNEIVIDKLKVCACLQGAHNLLYLRPLFYSQKKISFMILFVHIYTQRDSSYFAQKISKNTRYSTPKKKKISRIEIHRALMVIQDFHMSASKDLERFVTCQIKESIFFN